MVLGFRLRRVPSAMKPSLTDKNANSQLSILHIADTEGFTRLHFRSENLHLLLLRLTPPPVFKSMAAQGWIKTNDKGEVASAK